MTGARRPGAGPPPAVVLAVAALVVGALTAWAYRDVLAAGGRGVFMVTGTPLERGDELLHAWTLDWVYHQLAHDPRRLFDANVFYPQPASLALSDHLVGVAATLLPLRLAVADPLALNGLGTVATFLLAGVATAALVRALTGSLAAALVAGILYAFNPLRTHAFAQIQILTDYAVPIAFLFLVRWRRSGATRDLVGLGAAVAWATLCSAYVGLFLGVALGLVLGWGLVRGALPRPRLGAALAAAAVTAAMVVPFVRPYLWLRSLGLLRQHLLSSVVLSAGIADLGCWHDCDPYFGGGPRPLVLALAAVALWPRARAVGRGTRATFLAVAAIGALLAFGPFVHWASSADLSAAPGFVAPGPYLLLHRWLPGFDAVRVPVRALVLTHLGLAVLAGVGTARLLAAIGRPGVRRAVAALVVAGAALLVERPPLSHATLAATRAPDALDRWLAAHPEGGPVVQLPMGIYDDFVMYRSHAHHRPLANGYSGSQPPVYAYLRAALACYPCAEALDALAALGVRTHVLHMNLFPAAGRERLAAAVRAEPSLRLVGRFGDSWVVRLVGRRPRPVPPPLEALVPTGWRASASCGPRGVARALADDPERPWSTAAGLDDLDRPLAGLALLRAQPTWRDVLALVPRGPQWWALDLGRPTRVGGLAAGFSQDVGVPGWPAPVVEVSDDGERWRPLAATAVVEPSLMTLARDPRRVRYRWTWAPVTVRALRLTHPGYWSLWDVTLGR